MHKTPLLVLLIHTVVSTGHQEKPDTCCTRHENFSIYKKGMESAQHCDVEQFMHALRQMEDRFAQEQSVIDLRLLHRSITSLMSSVCTCTQPEKREKMLYALFHEILKRIKQDTQKGAEN